MGMSKKCSKIYKSMPNGTVKKSGLTLWRYTFSAFDKATGKENQFFIELEILNSLINPDDIQLGFKSRTKINAEDLQYALAGTLSASELQTEDMVLPSYCVIRAGMLGLSPKQICSYFPVSALSLNLHPFEIKIGNIAFTDKSLVGFVNFSEEDCKDHPEFLCNSGYASWEIDFDVTMDSLNNYSYKDTLWAPVGLKTNMAGKIQFDGTEYIINSKTSYGYIEKFSGKSIAEPFFHISSSNIQSIISGRTLFDSAFAIHGSFDNKVHVILNIEGNEIVFNADSKDNIHWDCIQSPQNEGEQKLHWTVSCNTSNWIVDVDLFCDVQNLYNRMLELPEGNRLTLSEVMTNTGSGEIKVYKKNRKNLEQIEYLRIANALCEYGNKEAPEN